MNRRSFLQNCVVVTGAAAAGMDVMANEAPISEAARFIKDCVMPHVPIEKIAYVSYRKAPVIRMVQEIFGTAPPQLPYFRTLHSIIYRSLIKLNPWIRFDGLRAIADVQYRLDNELVDANDLLVFGASELMPKADIEVAIFEGKFPSRLYEDAFHNIFSKSKRVILKA